MDMVLLHHVENYFFCVRSEVFFIFMPELYKIEEKGSALGLEAKPPDSKFFTRSRITLFNSILFCYGNNYFTCMFYGDFVES